MWQLSRPLCCCAHYNAVQFWYLNCLHGNFQGLYVAMWITMLSRIGTLSVCMATSKALCFPLYPLWRVAFIKTVVGIQIPLYRCLLWCFTQVYGGHIMILLPGLVSDRQGSPPGFSAGTRTLTWLNPWPATGVRVLPGQGTGTLGFGGFGEPLGVQVRVQIVSTWFSYLTVAALSTSTSRIHSLGRRICTAWHLVRRAPTTLAFLLLLSLLSSLNFFKLHSIPSQCLAPLWHYFVH